MAKSSREEGGWNVESALTRLRAFIDPYIWDQGQELLKRGAVEDFQIAADKSIHVQVLDPRDARKFRVHIEKDREGTVRARCACPYRLAGYCRHQVAALGFLRTVLEGTVPATPGTDDESAKAPSSPTGSAHDGKRWGAAPASPSAGSAGGAARPPGPPPLKPLEGPVLRRLFGGELSVATQPDGSLLRLVLFSLGSRRTLHRVGLQLFTGTGWTELRTDDPYRWIARGAAGPHPRDRQLVETLWGEGGLRRELDSEALGAALWLLAGSACLVDRSGRPLSVSPWPWRLQGRIAHGAGGGVSIVLSCLSREERRVSLGEVSLVASSRPWIQLDDASFHPLLAGATGEVLAALQEEALESVEGDDLDWLLTKGLGDLERLTLGEIPVEEGLIEEVEGVRAARVVLEGTLDRLSGPLELAYGGEWVPAPSSPEPWIRRLGGVVHRFPPAGQSLARAQRELEAMGFRKTQKGWSIERPDALASVLAPRSRPFVQMVLPPSLEQLDLVRREPVLRLRVEPGDVAATAAGAEQEGGGLDGAAEGRATDDAVPATQRSSPWLHVSFELLDGERSLPVDLPALRGAFEKRGRGGSTHGAFRLDDGSLLGLDHASVKSLIDLGSSFGAILVPEGKGRVLRIHASRAGDLLDEEAGRVVEWAPPVKLLVGALEGDVRGEVQLVSTARELLRPYQVEAVAWFQALARWGLSGILADEMGLGKTLMTLTHLFGVDREGAGRRDGEAAGGHHAGGRGLCLVVCPSSLVFNWMDECRRFYPQVRVEGLHGKPAEEREAILRGGFDLVVTSYALLRRDREVLESIELEAAILDEGQHIKNAESQTAKSACALVARERWILTGTPIENHLGELWSLFHFLMPGFLGASEAFQRETVDPIRKGEEDALRRLRARLRPFLLRRTKAEVLSELPPKIDQVERAGMNDAQRSLYDSYLQKAREELRGVSDESGRFQILAALTRLRQICCHPRLLWNDEQLRGLGLEPGDVSSGKFDLLLELLEECVEEGHRVLLYSQFTSMLDLIEERLVALGVERARLDGSTRDREGVVRRFQRDTSIPVFLISLKAGGFGLNLTEADTVILYDPWWNPAVEEQAAARAHRMGQRVPVHVHRLITRDSVEERIEALQEVKRDLAGKVVEGREDALGGLSLQDLKQLLL